MAGGAADEVVEAWVVEHHLRLAGVGEEEGMGGIALLVAIFAHHHHRILLVLENCTQH